MFGTGAIVVIALLVPLFLGPQLRAMFGKHHIVKLELEVVEVSRPSASGDVCSEPTSRAAEQPRSSALFLGPQLRAMFGTTVWSTSMATLLATSF